MYIFRLFTRESALFIFKDTFIFPYITEYKKKITVTNNELAK